MESNIPCVLIASKVDLPEVKQFHGMTPSEFCYKHRLPPPLHFSSVIPDSTNKDVFTKLAWAAVYPYVVFSPLTTSNQFRDHCNGWISVEHTHFSSHFQAPKWLRLKQRIVLVASGSGFCCSNSSGLCCLQSRC